MKMTLDMTELRGAISEAIHGLKSRAFIDENYVDSQTIDHLQVQFDVEGMTEDGSTGTFTPNDPWYDSWKQIVYGETRRMHKTHKLRTNVAQAGMDVRVSGDEITFEWSWDAISKGGINYGAMYQNDGSEKGRRLVLTDQFLKDLADDIADEVSEKIARTLST